MLRKNGRKHGVVYTKLDVVQFILDEVGFSSNENLENLKILEPASGTGAFAEEIIKRLYKSSQVFGFDFLSSLNKNVSLIEKDQIAFEKLQQNIVQLVKELGYGKQVLDCIYNTDYLFQENLRKFNCIVGNPPYIRHENLDSEYKSQLKSTYKTFKYRADLYVAFYEKSLDLLAKNGKLSFICSNRWLYNQYGELLRGLIASNYHLEKLVNIEKSSPFDEEVIGYPCISTIKNSKGVDTLFFETNSKEVVLSDISFRKVNSPTCSSWQNLFLDYDINHNSLKPIIEQDFEIGIGVATGADKVFIKKKTDLNGIERNRVLPIIKSNALKGEKICWDESFVLNPYENGNLCNLESYPHLKDYFSKYEQTLRKRHTAKKNPDNWYKTIDKIKSDLLSKPKLLLPDLAGSKFLFIDNGNFYPHHNVYYITNHNINRLKLLASLLMSDFIKEQLSQIGIRMNGGLPRFQSQTLKKLRIPEIDSLDEGIKSTLINAYDDKNLSLINKEINKYCTQHGI